MRRLTPAVVLLVVMIPWGWAQQAESPAPDIQLDTQLSRSVVRLGEVFEYRLRISYPQVIEFVTEELEERLVLRPFEIRSTRLQQRQHKDGKVLELVLSLVCYESPQSLYIPSFSLFYYPAQSLGSPAQQDVPAQALTIPRRPVQIYSTLVGEAAGLRDSVEVMRTSRVRWILPGLGALLLAGLLGGLGMAGLVWAIRRARVESVEDSQKVQAEALQELERLQQSGAAGTSSDYLKISKLIRIFLASKYGLGAHSLTPSEIQEALEGIDQSLEFGEAVRGVVEGCEQVFFNSGKEKGDDLTTLSGRALSLLRSSPEVRRAAN